MTGCGPETWSFMQDRITKIWAALMASPLDWSDFMRFDEMVMVIVNDKGNETNILTTFQDFTQEFLYPYAGSVEDAVMMIKELDKKQGKEGWAECYKAANKTVSAKYCSGLEELLVFLNGKYNDLGDGRFDIDLSSDDCLGLLERYGITTDGGVKGLTYHYEKKERTFRTGEILHNLNGTDYRVVEVFSPDNLLLVNEKSGNYVVGCNVEYFLRCPKYQGDGGREELDAENAEYGIEWGRGVYLSNKLSEIDVAALKKEYGAEPAADKQGIFEIEVREILSRVESVPAESLGEAIDRVTEQYKNGEIVLNENDYKGVDYIPLKEQGKNL